MDTPHYLRFARSLALLGGIGAAAAGCASTNTPGEDAASTTVDAASAPDAFASIDDAGPVPDDAFDICATCLCTGFTPDDAGIDAGVPSCETLAGAAVCCAAIGPLSPPDLAV